MVKRSYESKVRAEQAAHTRTRIADAAGTLFEQQGYGRTTIREVAEAAGVAVDTVYATFGTKTRVLTAVIDRRLAPDGEVSVLERPETLAVRDEPDQRRQIQLFAKQMAGLSAHVRPIFAMLRAAAAADAKVAPIYREMEGHRRHNMGQFIEWLAAHGPLRVSSERAGDIVWALASPETGRLLCDVQGWSNDDFAGWLEDTLVRTLLPDAD